VPVRSRIVFLDWLRGLAAIVMLQGHTFDSLLRPELRGQPAFIFSQFFGGQAAAIFLFLTGITFGLGMNRRSELAAWQRITGALRRARYLFLLAIAFRLQMWMFAWPHQPWTDLLHVDVLNLMGATAALLSVIALARGMRRVRWAVMAGVALAALAPVMSGLETGLLAAGVRDYFVPSAASFSMFPWGAYLAFGLAAGSAVPLVKRGEWSRVMQWAALCGFGLLLGGQYFSNLPFSIYSNANFWLNSPALVACKLGITLLLGSGAFLWTEYFSEGWSWVRLLGTTSLAVYWVHVELLYGRWLSFCKQNLTVWGCVAASLALILTMVGMSAVIRRLRQGSIAGDATAKRAAA
jgi:heparan-alpha-glucosaminide N-acetyltransferase-like protein